MSIDNLRNEINEINDSLTKLFVKRMEIASLIAEEKSKNGLPIYVEKRENDIISNESAKVPEDLKEYTGQFYRELFKITRLYESSKR